MQRRAIRICCTLAVLAGAWPAAARAQAVPQTTVYAVVSETESADGSTTRRETLAFQTISGSPVLTIANGSSASSFAVATASDGELRMPSADNGVTCYNMATALLSAYDVNATRPFPLGVGFLGHVVAVPLALHRDIASGGTETISAKGSVGVTVDDGSATVPSGLIVSAAVVRSGDDRTLESATFDEMSVAGTSPHPLDRNVCRIVRQVPNQAPQGA